ncbi:hypothetical protein OE88DRAFT_814928 [Heliocybe sulcata]|uniref:Secreted protein n=1 Tax=Heliocybe sulcata TaxID=5364 RepID=A0A5C3MP22_9AGAM|nr:hypothetical protein OE88DRAFT_814928 [Heliocybe sulcata]
MIVLVWWMALPHSLVSSDHGRYSRILLLMSNRSKNLMLHDERDISSPFCHQPCRAVNLLPKYLLLRVQVLSSRCFGVAQTVSSAATSLPVSPLLYLDDAMPRSTCYPLGFLQCEAGLAAGIFRHYHGNFINAIAMVDG